VLGITVRRSRSALGLILAFLMQAIALPGAERHSQNEYRVYAAEHPGIAERGEKVFQDEQRTGCVKCHSVDGTGSKAGPDLRGIGDKFQRTDLIRSVLEPAATIAIGYGTTILETTGGEEYQGVVKQATSAWLELMGGDGRAVRVETTEIQAQRSSDVSLMPEGLESSLSLEEFADLIAYLESLRGAPAPSSAAGMAIADAIPLATRGVELVPFFGNAVKLNHPVWFEEIPGLPNAYVVLEHGGKAWVIEKAPAERQHLLLDLSNIVRVGGATGLLGLAFHPNFSLNHKYYLKYYVIENGTISTVVVERQFDPKLHTDSGAISRQLLKVAAVTQDHNGGCLRFGPDGFLYIGMGDSGRNEIHRATARISVFYWARF
jgi:putative heme-binding domain-containing protein